MQQQLRQAAARCLSAIQRYHQGDRTAMEKARMVAEVEVVIGWLMELNPPPGLTESGILGPVQAHLLERYGQKTGRQINGEFLEAFEGAGMPLVYRERYDHLKCNSSQIS